MSLKTRLSVAVFAAVFVFSGFHVLPAKAAALTQTQISAILSLLQSFGADSSVINNVNQALGGTDSRGSYPCIDLSARTLTLGSKDTDGNEDVTGLQQFLIANGYLAPGYNTGYYGFLTAQAVGKFQLSRGIVTSTSDSSFGIVGTATRAALACSTTSGSPSATIDGAPSLVSTSARAIISGTATGNATFALHIEDANGYTVYGATLGPITNGRWSAITSALPTGTYKVMVYASGKGLIPDEALATATLVIFADTGTPSATIDQGSLSSSSLTPTISGSASNVQNLYLAITNLQTGEAFSSDAFSVSNGRWVVTLKQVTPGSYKVTVVGPGYLPLANGTLVVTTDTTAGPTINSFTASATQIALGTPITLSWNTSGAAKCYLYGPTSQVRNVPDTVDLQGSVTVTPTLEKSDFMQGKVATYALACQGAGLLSTGNHPEASKTIVVTLTGVPTLGTYIGYMNGNQFIKTENISQADALTNCKLNASSNLNATIRCTWNGSEIFNNGTSSISFTGYPSSGAAPLAVVFSASGVTDGVVNFADGSTASLTPIYAACVANVPNCGIRYQVSHTYTTPGTYTAVLTHTCPQGVFCIPLGTVKVTVASSATLGTYMGYMNGSLFITTKDISQSDALANCKLNATSNPNNTVRCMWNGTEIYNTATLTTPSLLYAAGVYGVSGVTSSFGYHPTGTITLTIPKVATPMILSLSAYEPVNWVIKNDNGTRIQRVILSGYHPQTISGISATVPVEKHFFLDYDRYTQGPSVSSGTQGQQAFYDDRNYPGGVIYGWASEVSASAAIPLEHRRYLNGSNDYFYASQNSGSDYTTLVQKLQTLTGLSVSSFVGAGSASNLAF